MTTHSEKNIDKLIAEFKLECQDGPKSIWLDRSKKRFVCIDAYDHRANTDLWNKAARFVFIDTINLESDHLKLRMIIEEQINKNIKDYPIYTSLSQHAEHIQRNESKWDEK